MFVGVVWQYFGFFDGVYDGVVLFVVVVGFEYFGVEDVVVWVECYLYFGCWVGCIIV